jgi:hypothetical protein
VGTRHEQAHDPAAPEEPAADRLQEALTTGCFLAGPKENGQE